MVEILQKEHSALREVAKEVPISNIDSEEIHRAIKDMKEAMRGEKDAVAIAAPQIGISLRIFVVLGKVFEKDTETEEGTKDTKDVVFINPEITKFSQKKDTVHEGCLSVRWWYGQVDRAEKVTVKAYAENGKKFTRGASGLLAQIFQHETDHLDGILFTDKATNLREEPPEKEGGDEN